MDEPTLIALKNRVLALLDEAYASRVNNLPYSEGLAVEALAISRSLADKDLTAKSLSQLALFHMIKGDYDEAASMSEEAIRYYEDLNDERGIADAKYNIAGIYYKTDNFHLGLVHLIDCLNIYRKFNDYHNASRTEKSLGTIYEFFGDPKNAVKAYNNAIDAALKAGDLNLESNAYNPLSGIYLKQGRIADALAIIERSITIKNKTGDTRGLAFAIYGRGKVFSKTGENEKAEHDFKTALAIHEQMGERLGTGMTYHKLASLYVEMGRLAEAKDIIFKAIDFSNTYNIVMIRFKCDYLLYRIYRMENDPVKSLEHLEHYLKEKEKVINTQTLKIIENYELIKQMESLEQEGRLQREKAEIMAKKEKAEQAALMKQEFLSAMSHEIRTPLNAVMSTAALLKDSTDEGNKQLLSSLRLSADHLLRIINDILDYTRLEAGKVQLEPRPVKLSSFLQGISDSYREAAQGKGLSLLLKTATANDAFYELDEWKLSQMLGNLLSNAIKFSAEGEVTLEVVKLSEGADSDILSFKISDKGEGISPDKLEEIFESFSQPKSVTTKRQAGTGLGLAIVKKLAELHSSRLRVDSVPGKGSVFHFELKLKRAVPKNVMPETQGRELHDKCCLLVEDNEINAMVARKILSRWGVVTEHVKNGLEAVEKAKEKSFDFILMDLHMPEMNGFDATEQIRTSENLNNATPIFALTADITAKDREEYTPYFNDFLWKPLEINRLFEALKSVA